jgi:hypothetical protein
VSDSTPYFFSHLDRIGDENYAPTVKDIIRVRIKTSGVHELEFTLHTISFRIVDVGGQRSERRKWIHCFQHVTAMIFFVAISEYNQFLIEVGDEGTGFFFCFYSSYFYFFNFLNVKMLFIL